MLFLMASAAFVGFVHSLAPGHWLPVVLLAKSRRWTPAKAAAASLVTASGHVLLSLALVTAAIAAGVHLVEEHEHLIEKYAGLGLALFGVAFAIYSYFRHSSCHGHTHHGPEPEARDRGLKQSLGFLFMVGFSPCVAVFPVFVAAMPYGWSGWMLTGLAFSAGVAASLSVSTLLASAGALKLDHPLFEHYGDVLTGAGVGILGMALFVFGGAHS